jgi:hypothetical protein
VDYEERYVPWHTLNQASESDSLHKTVAQVVIIFLKLLGFPNDQRKNDLTYRTGAAYDNIQKDVRRKRTASVV